jgi:Tol biopolymer transport system component
MKRRGTGRFAATLTVAVTVTAVAVLAGPGPAFGRAHTQLVSASPAGKPGAGQNYAFSISGTGRYVGFGSGGSNLVPSDTNGLADVFVRDCRTGTTELASMSSTGEQGNDYSYFPAVSANGRFVAFSSYADNLVPNDDNGRPDIFVRNLRTGTTKRVNVTSSGAESTTGDVNIATVYPPSISADGRYVAFDWSGWDLVNHDTNQARDIFVHDRKTGKTVRVSVGPHGRQANRRSWEYSISADGSRVAFSSSASNLTRHDHGHIDVFVHDLASGKTVAASTNSAGRLGNKESETPAISGDGRYVAYESDATNLVRHDRNGLRDIFVHDLKTGKTTRPSVDTDGHDANGDSHAPVLSESGRYVAFQTGARDLVKHDRNHEDDVVVRDRKRGKTRLVSLSDAGKQPDRNSEDAAISDDGRFVAFDTKASNMTSHSNNGRAEVYRRGPLR